MKTRKLLLYIFILNIFDAIFTWISVSGEAAYEINPIANWLIKEGPVQFFCFKIGIVSLALLFAYIRIKEDAPKYIYTFSIIAMMMLIVVFLGFFATLLTFL